MKKLPGACTVVIPKKASKSVTIKCSSAKAAKEAVSLLGKPSSRSSNHELESYEDLPSIIINESLTNLEQVLSNKRKKQATKKEIDWSVSSAKGFLRKTGMLVGDKLTPLGRGGDSRRSRLDPEGNKKKRKKFMKYVREALRS